MAEAVTAGQHRGRLVAQLISAYAGDTRISYMVCTCIDWLYSSVLHVVTNLKYGYNYR